MTTGNISLEIDELKARIFALETQLKEDLLDPVCTFEVVLRVTTRASTWGQEGVDCDKMRYHLSYFNKEIKEVLFLTDPGDSIKVQGVTEVT